MDFPDTSFLFAVFREQANSAVADAWMDRRIEPVPLSSLVIFEFRQSVRLQARLFAQDRTKGFGQGEADALQVLLTRDLESGLFVQAAVDWPAVHHVAELLSTQHTRELGCRFADILHVATALHLGARRFLTFDPVQRRLARAAKLETPLRA